MTTLNSRDACLSDFAIDRRLSAQLEAGAERAMDAHLASCTRCSLRFEVYERQRTAFLSAAPDWESFQVLRRRRGRQWLPGVAAGALALAAAAFAIFATPPGVPSRDAAFGTRSKGAPSIGVYVQHGNVVTRGGNGDAVGPGDRVRFTYSSDRDTSFALLHLDDAKAEVYYPLASTSVRVPAGRDAALDFAIELDASEGDERFFGVFCSDMLTLPPLRAALQRDGELPSLPDCHVDSIRLQKRLR